MPLSADMLRAFIEVAERQSVSAAADSLSLAKSVVSKRVGLLERNVGATLFSRSTRKIALTPAGEAYLEFARRALAELSAGEEQLRALGSELAGTIRVTAPVSWGQRVLCRRLPEFLRRHPAIEIDVQLADRVMDLAFERIDVAVRWSASPVGGLVNTPLADVRWLLAAAPEYLRATRPLHEPHDLEHHSCLGYWRERSDDAWEFEGPQGQGATEQVTVQARSRYRVDNPEAVLDAAIAGTGVAMLPSYLCDEALADGRLEPVLPAWTPLTRFGTKITAVGTPERMRLPRNRALVEFLRQPAA